MHGLNVAWLPGRIAQGATQIANTRREHSLTHHRVGPHGVEQEGFGHHLPHLTGQLPEHGHCLGP